MTPNGQLCYPHLTEVFQYTALEMIFLIVSLPFSDFPFMIVMLYIGVHLWYVILFLKNKGDVA